jgi:hypothetical protein
VVSTLSVIRAGAIFMTPWFSGNRDPHAICDLGLKQTRSFRTQKIKPIFGLHPTYVVFLF